MRPLDVWGWGGILYYMPCYPPGILIYIIFIIFICIIYIYLHLIYIICIHHVLYIYNIYLIYFISVYIYIFIDHAYNWIYITYMAPEMGIPLFFCTHYFMDPWNLYLDIHIQILYMKYAFLYNLFLYKHIFVAWLGIFLLPKNLVTLSNLTPRSRPSLKGFPVYSVLRREGYFSLHLLAEASHVQRFRWYFLDDKTKIATDFCFTPLEFEDLFPTKYFLPESICFFPVFFWFNCSKGIFFGSQHSKLVGIIFDIDVYNCKSQLPKVLFGACDCCYLLKWNLKQVTFKDRCIHTPVN